MTRDSFELLEGFINIGFCAFVEVRVVNVVGVVSSFFFDLRAADFGAMISSFRGRQPLWLRSLQSWRSYSGWCLRERKFRRRYRFLRSRRQQPRRRCRWSPERNFLTPMAFIWLTKAAAPRSLKESVGIMKSILRKTLPL